MYNIFIPEDAALVSLKTRDPLMSISCASFVFSISSCNYILQTQINIAISDMWLDLNQKNAKTPIPTYTIHMHINPDLSRFHQLTHGVKKEKPKSNQT